MEPIRFDYALKIAHYLQIYLGLSRAGALDFAFWQEREFLREYKFGGTIGGKFWQNNDRWYVQGYAVNLTSQHEVMIVLVNIKLAALKRRYELGKPAWITEPDVETLRTRCLNER